VKNLWKLDYPPQDPEQRWAWIYEVEDHLFGTREMQNELLRAWGFSYTRKDRRKKPLRDKMGGISLRAHDRKLQIMQLRSMNLSFRQIGAQLRISQVAAYKRYWCRRRKASSICTAIGQLEKPKLWPRFPRTFFMRGLERRYKR
jgi:hypothetical protein